MRVGIVVDNPLRDLGGCVLVARELLSRGIETALVPMYQQVSDVPLLGLDALVMNYARPNNFQIMVEYKRLGIALFVLDTEGGVLSDAGMDSPDSWARRVRDSGIADLVDGYFFWGNRLHRAFARLSGIPPECLHLTGAPRYDLCAPRWRELLRRPHNGYVLINTNFSAVHPLYSGSGHAERAAFISAGWEEQYIATLIGDLEKVFKRYLAALSDLIRDNPGLSFIVRPHPFEARNPYDVALGGYGNCVVDPTGSVFSVIYNSRGVVHLNCGTSVESILLGKVPISLEYLNTDVQRAHAPLPSRISYRADSYERLCSAVTSFDKITCEFDFAGLVREYIHPWFYYQDGGASTRVATVLAEHVQGGNERRSGSRKLSCPAIRGNRENRTAAQRAQNTLHAVIGSKWGSRLRMLISPTRRHKRFDADDVGQLMSDFDLLEGRPRSWKVCHARHAVTGFPLASVLCSS